MTKWKKVDFKLLDSQIKIGKRRIPVHFVPLICGVVAVYLIFVGAILVLVATIISLLIKPLF
jgi:hypothetical protein